MATDDDMRSLLEQMLPSFNQLLINIHLSSNPGEIVFQDSFVPSGFITREFVENMKTAVEKKKLLILERWKTFFAISCLKALSSHEMYLRYVMFACEFEIGLSNDVFDNILSVLLLVINFNLETLENTAVNFYNYTVDIFMEFYEWHLKEPFYWYDGFEGFAEYLRNKNLLEEGYFDDGSEVPATYTVSLQKVECNKFEKVFEKVRLQPSYITHDDVINNVNCHILAKEVLFMNEKELPTLPPTDVLKFLMKANRQRRVDDSKRKTTATDLKGRMPSRANSKREEVLLTGNIKLQLLKSTSKLMGKIPTNRKRGASIPEKEETTGEGSKCATRKSETPVSHLFSNSRRNYMLEQKANIDWCNNIVQRVIKYNNSQSSHPTDENKHIQNDAEEILEHLKGRIHSLINFLDESDEE